MLPQRRDQLLAFLAHAGDWVERHRIARLLWSEQDEAASLRNLRHLLHHLALEGSVPELVGTRRALRIEARVDTADFAASLAAEDWERAVSIYRGPFLAGMEEAAEGAFGNWLTVEREHLRGLWRRASLRVARVRADRGDHAGASTCLEPLLRDDPLDETALQALVVALNESGDRGLALAALERFERSLERDLGILPTATTRALAAAVRDGLPLDAGVRRGEPARRTLFGRDEELATLLRWLVHEDARVVTIIGPGGVGKSSLAATVAATIGPGIGRYATVTLDGVDHASQLLTSIAAALGVPPGEREVDLDGLAVSLSETPTLLVLDAAEQVAGLATVAAALLDRDPHVRLLVTSHERLHLPGERVLPLSGLAFEATADGEELLDLPAVALFVALVRRHEPLWRPDVSELRAVQTIARNVDGSPLALQLAAPWIRTLSVEAIAREVASDLDFLREPERVGPRRQRSLRATFEYAWGYLQETERTALRRLAVFDGGFRREAASVVAGAQLPVLSSLVEASLLRRHGSRFEQHALLRRFALEKLRLEPDEEREVRRRHAEYHADLLRTRFPAHGFARAEALAIVDEEYANLVSAWGWALESGAVSVVETLAEALSWWCELRGRASEGVKLLSAAVDGVATADWMTRQLLARLLAKRAWLRHWLEHETADDDAGRALKLARAARDGLTAAAALRVLGLGAWRLGRYAEAEERITAAIALAKEADNDMWLATLLDGLGLVAAALGRFEESEAAQQRAFALNSRIGNAYQTVQNLINLAAHSRRRGDLAGATMQAAEAARLARESGFRHYLPHALTQLAACQHDAGDWEEARRTAGEARALAEAGGDTYVRVWSALQLARLAAGRSEVTLAAANLHQALTAASRSGDQKQLLQGLVVAATLAATCGETTLAERWCSAVAAHPGTPEASRLEARRIHRAVSGSLPHDAPAVATPELSVVVDEVLAAAGIWRIEA